jgi:hypothetical protein
MLPAGTCWIAGGLGLLTVAAGGSAEVVAKGVGVSVSAGTVAGDEDEADGAAVAGSGELVEYETPLPSPEPDKRLAVVTPRTTTSAVTRAITASQ